MHESVTCAIPVGLKVFPISMLSHLCHHNVFEIHAKISVYEIKIRILNSPLIFRQLIMVINDSKEQLLTTITQILVRLGIIAVNYICLVGWFCCFTSQVSSHAHCWTVSSPNHTFSWAGLNKRLTSNSCTYFGL